MGTPLFQAQRQFILDPGGFRKRQLHPVLLWTGTQPVDGDAPELPTQTGRQAERPAAGDVLLVSVEKQALKANAFAMGITVGRVQTNDVVLDDASISRFHAYFQFDARKNQWTLTDADSQNGTSVAGQRTKGHHLVEDGSIIVFGSVSTRFLLPGSLCAWLEGGADPSAL